ncbi:MAG: endolytic transglycosylase MltG [Flavobacteriaceae bacterium]|nr:endolytic transglycosylase MltG [Flavobacteriaceae bacterium]
MLQSIKRTIRFALVGTGAIFISLLSVFYFPNTKVTDSSQSIFVPSGTSFATLKGILEPHLRSTVTFSLAAKAKRFDTPRIGHFVLKPNMGNQQIINALRSGNTPIQVVFNNQQTIAHLAGRVAEQLELDSLSLNKEIESPYFMESVNLNREELLSLFLPNSYEMYWNISAAEFCQRMKRENDLFWNESRESKRKRLKMSRAEVITLAAIVNEESRKVDERPRVAGVYLNRLRRGMKLQADPTVVYAMKRQTNDFDLIVRRVLYKDLEIKSPYNTYKYPGLPPGPITMPDISSVDAVLNAESHSYLFFVVDPKNPGYHLFASTYNEHLAYRKVYVRWLNENRIMR